MIALEEGAGLALGVGVAACVIIVLTVRWLVGEEQA
jgi:hypothetical protein